MGYQSRKSEYRGKDKPHTQPDVGGVLERRKLEAPRSRPEYARFRLWLIGEILSKKLTPLQVAQLLEKYADRFPEVEVEECRRYREWGETWQKLPR